MTHYKVKRMRQVRLLLFGAFTAFAAILIACNSGPDTAPGAVHVMTTDGVVNPIMDRYTEAMYHLGLAQHHLGKKKRAQKTWGGGIKSCSQDPWIYRADWAFTQSKEKRTSGGFSSGQKKTSLLKRIGYMGRRNPDLSGPPKKLKLRRKVRGKKGKAE